MRALGDTSGIYAYLDEEEDRHDLALSFLSDPQTRLVVPDTIVEELFALLRRRMGTTFAFAVADGYLSGAFGTVEAQTEQDRADTWQLLRDYMGVPLSYVDASVIVLGRRLGISDVFSFDSDFRLAGLQTVP